MISGVRRSFWPGKGTVVDLLDFFKSDLAVGDGKGAGRKGGQAVFLTFSIQAQQNVVQRTTPLVRLVIRNQLASSQVTRRSRPASISRTSSGAPTSRSIRFPPSPIKKALVGATCLTLR